MSKSLQRRELAGTNRVLVVDDDVGLGDCLVCLLHSNGYETELKHTVEDGLRTIRSEDFDLIITDLKLPDSTGLDLIRGVNELAVEIPVILMTCFSSTESAIQALRLGATDYLIKPFVNADLLHAVARALNERRLKRQNRILKRDLNGRYGSGKIVAKGPEMKAVFDMIDRVAKTDAQVLIQGESGTGKEVIARALHQSSARCEGSFVAVNCGAIPADLMESELFGHVRGAFTGASDNTEGLIREAIGGTLLLDEISELPLNLQVKLLRVLQEREVRPVGSNRNYSVDVRFVAATNKDLDEQIRLGTFREDLYFRLNVININVPPLRVRGEDVDLLAESFIAHYSKKMGKQIRGISDDLANFLHAYEWPGNVRELENLIERAVILADGDTLTLKHLGNIPGVVSKFELAQQAAGRVPMPVAMENLFGRRLSVEGYIQEFVRHFQGQYSETELAHMLGIGRKALWSRRRKWGLSRPERPLTSGGEIYHSVNGRN